MVSQVKISSNPNLAVSVCDGSLDRDRRPPKGQRRRFKGLRILYGPQRQPIASKSQSNRSRPVCSSGPNEKLRQISKFSLTTSNSTSSAIQLDHRRWILAFSDRNSVKNRHVHVRPNQDEPWNSSVGENCTFLGRFWSEIFQSNHPKSLRSPASSRIAPIVVKSWANLVEFLRVKFL